MAATVVPARPGSGLGEGRHRRIVLVGIVLAAGCRSDSEPPAKNDDGSMTPATTGDEGTSTGEPFEPTDEASDLCERAPTVGAGSHHGSLRGFSSELEGACGDGGPDAFFRLELDQRSDVRLRGLGAGFVPRVGVLPNTCSPSWSSRTMLCDEGVGTWLLDVAAGSSLVVSVGIDPDNPQLGLPPPAVGADPLSFELQVTLRNVLEVGEPCEPPDRGRCGTGTACLPVPPSPDDPDAVEGPAVCTLLEADTCATAAPLSLSLGITALEIDPATPQTDAHVHSCGGGRRAERVLRLELPADGPHELEVRADRPGVGLAVRGAGCLPEDERGCVVGADSPPPPLVVELSESDALLFVELPPDDPADGGDDTDGGSTTGSTTGSTGGEGGEEAPIVVELELSPVESPPP